MKYLCAATFIVKAIITNVAAVCQMSPNIVSIKYSDTILNNTIVGPVLSSITATDERKCERECHLAIPNLCYMFNYYPSSKVCELLYKDRTREYRIKKKKGSTFKTRKCKRNPCSSKEKCYSLGDQNRNRCFSNSTNVQGPGGGTHVIPRQVCFGTKKDFYGSFVVPADGNIISFKLVHISGGVSSYYPHRSVGKWGSVFKGNNILEVHITDDQNTMITPPTSYPLYESSRLSYKLSGYDIFSPEIILPEILPPLSVTEGKEFRVWFGQDLLNTGEGNNEGITCAGVYVYYIE